MNSVSSSDRIRATYRIETRYPLDKAAELMAGEQSSGTFLRIPGETADLVRRHGAKVESVKPLEASAEISLPGSRPPKGQPADGPNQRAEVILSFPVGNIGPSLVNLMTLVAGNLFELSPFSGLRLVDLELPRDFTDAFTGPAFGIEGTRRLSGVRDRPLFGTIIKPSVGLSPKDTAKLVRTLCEAGLDFIKDDELIADAPYSPLRDRVQAVMRVINRHADKTGKKVMFAFNISDEIDAMRRHHDTVAGAGGTCVMVSLNSVGLAGVQALRKISGLPIHGHRNGWGALSRHPQLGFSYSAWQQFWKLAGVDHLHVNGLQNKFCEENESVIVSARACLAGIHGRFHVLPVFSSGQWAKQAFETYRHLQSLDLLYVCGGGIIGHPSGVTAGVHSIQQAWKAAAGGESLESAATNQRYPELCEAFDFFGDI